MSDFKEYIEHGWKLVPILPGHKGPSGAGAREWNHLKNCVTDPAIEMHSAGLAHAYSGTCAIDVDDYAKARDWLEERGINIDILFLSPTSVQISSGRAGRGKLLYALDTPIVSKQFTHKVEGKDKAFIDFRCATASGLTVQDVLPPSIHPDTGRPYVWQYADDLIADWRSLPPLPDILRKIWLDEIEQSQVLTTDIPDKGASTDELHQLLAQHDPNMGRDDWIKVGMAIHHETDGSMEGLMLWDEWSAKSGEKYAGIDDLKVCWRSFHDTPNAVTVGMLRQGASATPEDFPVVDDEPDDPWDVVAQERAARFNLVHASEYAKREPPEWIIEDVLPKADLAMIYGESGVGKSFVALDMGLAIATGLEWGDKKVEKQTVIWIAAEAAGSMAVRTRAYAHEKGMQLENADLWVIGETPALMNTEDAVALTEAVKAKEPGLIIVDTLAAASMGANENSGEDMNIVIGTCRMLHDKTGALVLLVHHTGKDLSKGARGWSGLKAAMHTEILVAYHQTMRKIQVMKQRDGEEGIAWPFRLMPVALDMSGLTSCYVDVMDRALLNAEDAIIRGLGGVQRTVLDCVMALIRVDGAGVPTPEIHDEVLRRSPTNAQGRPHRGATINRALADLQNRGLIEIDDNIVRMASDDSE